jgi:hypothetical protein
MPIPRLVTAVAVALLTFAAATPAGAADPASCDRYAAASGSDANPGTAAQPVGGVRRLMSVLAPGETGCLRPGDTFHQLAFLEHGGAAGAPVTLTSGPGTGRANVTGQYVVNASHVRIRNVRFAGLGAAAAVAPKSSHLMVNGDDVQVLDSEITSPKGTCLDVGDIDAYAPPRAEDGITTRRADDFVLAGSRIHGCGQQNWTDGDFSSRDSGIHGVYLVHARRVTLRDNVIEDVINRGIQLWPAVSEALIEHNTLDANGSNLNVGSSAAYGHFSTDVVARDNVITNAALRSSTTPGFPHGDDAQVVGYFPDDADRGNRVQHNCLFGVDPVLDFAGRGLRVEGNLHADPRYRDRAAGDLRVASDSPCAGMGVRTLPPTVQQPPAQPQPAPQAPGTGTPAAPGSPAVPAAGQPQPAGPVRPPRPQPALTLAARPGQSVASLRRRGLRLTIGCAAACQVHLTIRVRGRIVARAVTSTGPAGPREIALRLHPATTTRLASTLAPFLTVTAATSERRRTLRVALVPVQRDAGA